MAKKKVVVIVGSGFSAGLTSGDNPPIGNGPVPTLSGFTEAVTTQPRINTNIHE
ncbi:MAG: hypothetical protein QME81_18975 [bacterium]|nr:hypothetical protein [bacterium]